MQRSVAGVYFRGFRPGKALANISGAEGGMLDPADCAGVGSGAVRAGVFLPVEAAGGCKTVAGAYFRGRGACTQYDPKVILDPKGDAYYGSSESLYVSPKMFVCKIHEP